MVELSREKVSTEVHKAPATNLKLRGEIIQGLQDNLLHGGHSLSMIPSTIATIVDNNMWQEWVVPVTGEVKTYQHFEDFVRCPRPEGLSADLRKLKHLCRDDKEALDAIDRATVGKHGTNQHTKPKVEEEDNNNITVQTGTSNTYALRKLRKDRPDLHEQVLAKEKSPHAAMVEAGFRPRTATVYPEDLDRTARILLRHFDLTDLQEALERALG